jgi:hypothetical protein
MYSVGYFSLSQEIQIFWALYMVRRWDEVWYYVGIADMVILEKEIQRAIHQGQQE